MTDMRLTKLSLKKTSMPTNFIAFGCILFITQSVFVYFIEKLDGVVFQVVIYMIVVFAEIAWLEFEHNVMKKKMIKK